MRLLNRQTYFSIYLVFLFSFFACSEEDTARVCDNACLDVSITDSKVFAEGSGTYWNSEDLVSVFFYSGTNECWYFEGEDGSRAGKLHASGIRSFTRDKDNVIAIYPYSAMNALDGSVATVELPSKQKFQRFGSFGSGSAVLGANSQNNTLEFRYLSGFAALRFNGPCSVKKITLHSRGGENLSGQCKADFSLDDPALSDPVNPLVELEGPFVASAGDEVLFSLVPQNYASGLEWSIQHSNGCVQTVRCAGIDIRPGVVAEPVVVNPSSSLTLSMSFCLSDGSAGSCPFTSKPGKEDVGSLSKAYYLASDTSKSYPFRFFVQNWTGENLRFTGAGLNIGGTAGDYMLLPGIPGKRLSKIKMAGRYAFEYRVDDFGPFALRPEDCSVAVLPDTATGVPYKLYFGLSTLSDGVCKIYNLILDYEDK